MANKMNSWPLEDFDEIFPIMSIPHTENGHGEVSACNSEGGTWMRSHVSDTLDISKQTGNNLSPWSAKNSQSSWSYGLTYVLPYVVHILSHEPLSSLDRQRCGPSTIIISHLSIVYTMSLHKSQIKWPTISILSYPWPWQPQDMHKVLETGICHGTKVSHHQTLPHQSSNSRQEQIST